MAISDKQLAILAFPYTHYDALICDGAIRSGKTVFMTIAFIDWAMQHYNRCRFGVCGATVDSTIKNVIRPYQDLDYSRQRYRLQWRRTDKLLIVSDGKNENWFEVFGGKDESSYRLIQGRTLAGVFLDEVVLQPRSFVEQALARCSVEGSRFWFSCNPASPAHWFYTEWVLKSDDHNALHLHFTLDDNPSLSEKMKSRYRSLYTGVFYQRYILGEWVQAEGLVYSEFGSGNILDTSGLKFATGLWVVSCDYGTLNPCVFGLWWIDRSDRRAIMVDEYYWDARAEQRQKTDDQYYDDLCKFVGNRKIDRIVIDPSAASFKTLIRQRGRFAVKDADNSVVDGIRTTSALLANHQIMIDRRCKRTIAEFGLYSWDTKSTQDAVVKEYDHSMDQMRYMVMTVLRREFR